MEYLLKEGKHMTHKTIHGYKGFESNMTCRSFRYEVGKTYEMNGKIEPCEHGFHFCQKMADVFNYYGQKGCRYAEVEGLGEVINERNKYVTNKLHVVRELTWAEILNIMYAQEGRDFKDEPFPADKIIKARDAGTLGKILPSGTEFPVTFANGEKNILVVGRDKSRTYLVAKYLMAKKFAMNDERTNKGGWPACRMREHVQGIYDMLPKDIRRVIVPMHIRQIVRDEVVECEDRAFLLSSVNVFGKDAWDPEADCYDTQIDIFREAEARMKKRPGASSASWWWLRSAYGSNGFYCVDTDGSINYGNADYEGGVVVGFCIETRS